MKIQELIQKTEKLGYTAQDAKAIVCQDIILKAISQSDISKNATIKGGVVMRYITKNARRTTQDIDIDFIKYSLSDLYVDRFIEKLNCINHIKIKRIGNITELRQQDYHGKSVRIQIEDDDHTILESKIDFGVHNHLEINQQEYCFEIVCDNNGVSLFINSIEQMFVEKLKSLLKFGRFSTRYKDIYDMYYIINHLYPNNINQCLNTYVYSDTSMKENNINDIIIRISNTFSITEFKNKVNNSDKRWIDEDINIIFQSIIDFLKSQ